MDDYLARYRMTMIDDFQKSLKDLRVRMECSMSHFAEFIGVTRQTINNLESGRVRMSASQFLSLAAAVDNYISTRGRNALWVEDIANGGYYSELEYYPISKRWFSCFEGSREILLENSLCRARGEYVTAMRQLVARYTIFLDYGVFFNYMADAFLSSLADLLSEAGKKAVVSIQSVDLLEQLARDTAYRTTAGKALVLIDRYQQEGVLDLREDVKRDCSVEMILSASGGRENARGLCLITLDSQLMRQMLGIAPPEGTKSLDLLVGFVNGVGRARVRRWTPPTQRVSGFSPEELSLDAFDAPPPQRYIPGPDEEKIEV